MTLDLPIGAELGGRFRLVERLPDGPYGPCWRADDFEASTARLAFVQSPRPCDGAARSAVFERAVRFGHPNAVAARAHGAHEGSPFVASALPEGKALRAWRDEVSAGGLLPLRDVRTAVDQVAQCLAAAHRGVDGAALVHGGRLASSVWVERRGEVQFVARLGDWGVAWASAAAEAPPGAGDEPAVADDIYGLGVLLVELLAREGFGTAREAAAACEGVARARPEVHASVWSIARRCLSSKPAERPDGVARVRELVRQAVWTPQEVRAAPEPAPPPPPPPPPPPAAPERARVVAVRASLTPSPPAAERVSSPPPAVERVSSPPAVERVSLPVPAPALAPPRPAPPPAPPPAPAQPSPAPAAPVVEAPTARTSLVEVAPNTELSLTSPAPAMKLGASRLGLATVTRTRSGDARSFQGPEERTEAVTQFAGASEVLPIDVQSTLRTPRSLLAEEATEVHPIAADATSMLDVSALPPGAPEGHAAAAPRGRRGTFLPVAGPDAAPEPVGPKPPAEPPAGEGGRTRASTVPMALDALPDAPAVEATLDTQRPALRAPSPTPSPAPQHALLHAPLIDTPTDPSITLPPPAPAPAPLSTSEELPPEGARVPWWIPALAAAALLTLVVAAVSALQ